ncbi:MAG: TolC family protein [Byssovorax sp.]
MSTSARRAIAAAESAPEVGAGPGEDAVGSAGRRTQEVAARREAALAEAVDRPTLEAVALADQPSLEAGAHRARALIARARAEGSLPPPELMSEIWQVPLSAPYRLDKAGMIMISLRQQIPAPGSLDLTAEATALEARAAATVVAVDARSLVREIDRAFADYVETTERHRAHLAHRAIVERMVAVAGARYPAGAPLGDLTKADLERTRLEVDVARERGAVAEVRARLNGLLARPMDAPLGAPRDDAPETVAPSAHERLRDAAAKNPQIATADLMHQAAETSARALDREATLPSFMVGLDYFHPVRSMPVGWGASLSMSLPWVWGAASSRAESAGQRALAERAAIRGVRVRVDAEFMRALAAVDAAAQRFVLLRDLTRPAAQRALDAAQAGYSGGGTTLLAWLDAERSSLDVEVEIQAARADLARALADLDWAAGERVARAPLPAAKEVSHER